jgi:LPXTG-site transpeptidase (sortase) family protein
MNTKDFWIIGIITLVIFTGTYAMLSIFGFAPKEFQVVENTETSGPVDNFQYEEETETGGQILYPDKVTISKIGVESVIEKPQSQDVNVLDQALNKGAVYYPGSGTIDRGNMFLFGHSTGFSVVNNQAFKTFNDLNKLEKGDEITIDSDGRTFIYKVTKLSLVDENSAFVDFTKTDRMLTISTCNSFGAKQDRWVVEARFDREV